MPLNDSTLTTPGAQLAVLVLADFVDLPLRLAYAPFPLAVPADLADGDADCWNQSFGVINTDVISITPPQQGAGGSGTLTVTLLADPGDAALLNAIETPALYAGRNFRMWLVAHDGAGTVTELRPLFTGTMTVPGQASDGASFVVAMEAESYLALLGAPQGRTYLNQANYDASDKSAEVTVGQGRVTPAIGGSGNVFSDILSREWVKQL